MECLYSYIPPALQCPWQSLLPAPLQWTRGWCLPRVLTPQCRCVELLVVPHAPTIQPSSLPTLRLCIPPIFPSCGVLLEDLHLFPLGWTAGPPCVVHLWTLHELVLYHILPQVHAYSPAQRRAFIHPWVLLCPNCGCTRKHGVRVLFWAAVCRFVHQLRELNALDEDTEICWAGLFLSLSQKL